MTFLHSQIYFYRWTWSPLLKSETVWSSINTDRPLICWTFQFYFVSNKIIHCIYVLKHKVKRAYDMPITHKGICCSQEGLFELIGYIYSDNDKLYCSSCKKHLCFL